MLDFIDEMRSHPIRQRPGLLHEPRQRSRWRRLRWPLRTPLRLCLSPVLRPHPGRVQPARPGPAGRRLNEVKAIPEIQPKRDL